jgi:AcrR family transcriptional regulator
MAAKTQQVQVAPAEEGRARRSHDPDKTRANILDVATRVFAEKGLSGSRIDEIAEMTNTSKRMIYYYFDSKDGLYQAVLEESYRRIRTIEGELKLAALPPLEALAQLVRFTFDYENANEDFIRLVMVENIHNAAHLKAQPNIASLNSGAIDRLRGICERGVADGEIRAEVDPLDLHMSISALCFFNVSNRHTFSTIFNVDMGSKKALAERRASVARMIVRFVATPKVLAANPDL